MNKLSKTTKDEEAGAFKEAYDVPVLYIDVEPFNRWPFVNDWSTVDDDILSLIN